MKRKVIKQGNGTLTITLPKQWTEDVGLKGGDEIDLTEMNKNLVIGEHKDTRERKISVDVSNLDRTTIFLIIQGIYRYGYDFIEIISQDSTVPHYRIGKNASLSPIIYQATERLVGAEVISASPKRYVIKRLAVESVNDFPTVMRRVFLLFNEMMESFIQGVEKNDTEILKSMEFQHLNIKKFINLSLRLLNKFGYEDTRKTCFYFHVISLLSKAEDIIKNNSRYMIKYNIRFRNRKSIQLLKDIKDSVRMYYEIFYSYKLDKIRELGKHRDNFREKIFKLNKEMSKEENLVLGGLSQIIEIILDMTETRIALED